MAWIVPAFLLDVSWLIPLPTTECFTSSCSAQTANAHSASRLIRLFVEIAMTRLFWLAPYKETARDTYTPLHSYTDLLIWNNHATYTYKFQIQKKDPSMNFLCNIFLWHIFTNKNKHLFGMNILNACTMHIAQSTITGVSIRRYRPKNKLKNFIRTEPAGFHKLVLKMWCMQDDWTILLALGNTINFRWGIGITCLT